MREMKESGNVWYGKIPYAWELNKIKYLTTIRSESAIYNPEEDKYIGLENVNGYSSNVVETDTEYDYSMQSICKKDDILFSKLRPYLAKVFIAKHNSFCTREFIVFSSFNGDRRYLFYSILNPKFIENINSSTYGAKMPRANPQYIIDQQICLPPLDEQQRIAEFLDKECGKIDGLKADIQAQIDTLEQYKRSIITEAVTHGLNPSAPMKDSGAGWMPLIPLHWKADKLKFHLRQRGIKNQIDKQVLSLYREYGIVPKDSREDNHNVTSEDVSDYRYVRVGDFVVNKMKAWQGSVAVSDYEGIVSPAYFVYEFSDDLINKRYFHYLMRNKTYATEFRRLSGGIREGQWDLPSEALNNTIILLPPLDEQQEIADYLDNKCAEIEQIIADKKSQIETLDGYKKSLIYEYVTGKKEVI